MAYPWRWLAGTWVLTLACVLTGRPALAQGDSAEKVFQRTLKATVWVVAPGGMMGTGSVIDAGRRLVVTNHHVVGRNAEVVVIFPMFSKGKLVAERDAYLEQIKDPKGKIEGARGKVLAADVKVDLALVQLDDLPAWVQPLPLAATSPGPGQRIHSVGNPGSSDALWVYTSGTVRAVYHKKWQSGNRRETFDHEADVIETQLPTNPGDSGGPLVNDRGELAGVTQSFDSGARLASVFIDVSEVKALLRSKNIVVKGGPALVAASTTTDQPPTPPPSAEDKNEQVAAARLKIARLLVDGGKADRARDNLREIVEAYPKTKAAIEAKVLLEKLK
jgi:S1-C subfamily serine protease